MKYERIIMLVFILLFFFGFLSGPLTIAENWLINTLFKLTGMGSDTVDYSVLRCMLIYIQDLVII